MTPATPPTQLSPTPGDWPQHWERQIPDQIRHWGTRRNATRFLRAYYLVWRGCAQSVIDAYQMYGRVRWRMVSGLRPPWMVVFDSEYLPPEATT